MEIQNVIDFENEDESETFVQAANVRQSQVAAASWDQMVVGAIEVASRINPFKPDVPLGEVVPAVEAVGWSCPSSDIRPRLRDDSTGQFRLIDSGSMITAAKRNPEDKIDNTIKLIAVNGSRIPTYGVREISFNIGRKRYSMQAVVCDVKQDILGMDFLDKYKLSLSWDDQDQSELYLVDKRAQIRKKLQIITVPTDLQRIHYLESSSPPSSSPPQPSASPTASSPESVLFQVSCVKSLGEDKNKPKSLYEIV